jgi:hypothetical protein
MMKEALAQLKQQHQAKVAEWQKQRAAIDSKGLGAPLRKLAPESKPEAFMNLTDPDAGLLPPRQPASTAGTMSFHA